MSLTLLNEYTYYLVSFDCFPLFLPVLTSLIKRILWLSVSTDKRQVENMGGKDHRVLLRFKMRPVVGQGGWAGEANSPPPGRSGVSSCDPGSYSDLLPLN